MACGGQWRCGTCSRRQDPPGHKIVRSKASTKGMCCQAAGGAEIPHEGQTINDATTEDGTILLPMAVQAAPVGVNIISVRD